MPHSPSRTAALGSAASILLGAWIIAQAAHAESQLSRCAGKGVEDDSLTVTSGGVPAPPGCNRVALPIDAAQILAVAVAPSGPSIAPDPKTITITGERVGDAFQLRAVDISAGATPQSAPYLVPGSDLRAVANVSAFGPPGRAAVRTDDDQTTLDCAPGTEPAGLAFATLRVPPIPGMGLRITHSADQVFLVAVADPAAGKLDPGSLAEFTELESADSASEGYVPLTTALPADQPLELLVLCPPSGGHLQLDGMLLEARAEVPTERSAWLEDAQRWLADPARVFARAQRWQLTRLYISIPMDERGPTDTQALAAFLAEASNRGIEVWALLRDREDGTNARAAAALADYNQAVPQSAQLRGTAVEYAPERRWRYAADPAAAALRFIDRLEAVKAALGMPLWAIVPSWFPTEALLAERYARTLDGMVVLTDRTDPDDIRNAVIPFLVWGTHNGKPIEVALETGPLPGEEQTRFARAPTGELWLVSLGGARALLLLKDPAGDLPGLGFARQESTALAPEDRSFSGRRSVLREALAPLGRTLGAWPAFAGFAFHELFVDRN